MKKHYFLATILLIAGTFFLNGCGSQINIKAESLNSEGTNSSKSAEPVSKNEPVKQTRQVLWDFKKSDTDKPQTISKAETAAVLKYLFGSQTSPELELTNRVSG